MNMNAQTVHSFLNRGTAYVVVSFTSFKKKLEGLELG